MFSDSSTTMRPRTMRTRSWPDAIILLNRSIMSRKVASRAWAWRSFGFSSSIELVHVRHALLRVFDVHAHLAQALGQLRVFRSHALEAVLQLALILLELVERAGQLVDAVALDLHLFFRIAAADRAITSIEHIAKSTALAWFIASSFYKLEGERSRVPTRQTWCERDPNGARDVGPRFVACQTTRMRAVVRDARRFRCCARDPDPKLGVPEGSKRLFRRSRKS